MAPYLVVVNNGFLVIEIETVFVLCCIHTCVQFSRHNIGGGGVHSMTPHPLPSSLPTVNRSERLR